MNAPSIVIVGQGLAGTLLAYELECHGADFLVLDAGPEAASRVGGQASAVAAGIINPLTGQRIVKSWRIDALLPLVRETYRAIEVAWGITVWRDMRVRRLWRDDHERRVFLAKQARGELEPFGGVADDQGFWIEQAGHVDVQSLLGAARRRWTATGRFIEKIEGRGAPGRGSQTVVVLCTGAALRNEPALAFVPWSVAKGELLTLTVEGLVRDVILNRGHWVLPLGSNDAKIGATYVPGAFDLAPSPAARAELEKSARGMLAREFQVKKHEAGLRLTLPDKHPVAGRVPGNPGLGVLGGLGSKGALLAPWLARQWWNHLSEGVPFDPTIDVARFLRR